MGAGDGPRVGEYASVEPLLLMKFICIHSKSESSFSSYDVRLSSLSLLIIFYTILMLSRYK